MTAIRKHQLTTSRKALSTLVFAISVFSGVFLTLSFSANAQQVKKIVRVGFLSGASPVSTASRVEGFIKGLQQLGYIEGQNIFVEHRYADGKLSRLPKLAKELVELKVDVIVAVGATATTAAKKSTEVIPIVMTNTSDPVVLGLIASLAKPGANVTGLSNLAPDLSDKRLELLKEATRKLYRVAVLGDPSSPSYEPQMNEVSFAAREMSLHVQPLEIQASTDLETAFSSINRWRAEALVVLLQPSIGNLWTRIIELTNRNLMPSMGPQTEFAEAGGLLSYGANTVDLYRRAATFVDKILKAQSRVISP